MKENELDFAVERLGECTIPSPFRSVPFVSDEKRVLYHNDPTELRGFFDRGVSLPAMEVAGPREKIFFDAKEMSCGIVTCGGLCPGLNDVIRAIVMSLFHHYGVTKVYGFRYGYEGLVSRYGHEPLNLTPETVSDINKVGGTILGSSRGPQKVEEMVDTLERLNVRILFTTGGDGTLKGASAISQEVTKRGLKISVIGIPKTIDNDISYIDRSFGFFTAGSEARRVVVAAHNEAHGGRNGVGLVKLMGRDSGFIAAYAALAASEVNFCLIREAPFTLEGFLKALEERIVSRGHAVVVAAEGAGQNIIAGQEVRDASGNILNEDIGIFLRDKIKEYFKKKGMELNLKYIDPSYTIRSVTAEANDAGFCMLLGHNAVHAGMTGRTNMVVGHWAAEFTHVPISLAVSKRKKIDPNGWIWGSVLACTGQPKEME
jgi:6-phosphofructokinase 1